MFLFNPNQNGLLTLKMKRMPKRCILKKFYLTRYVVLFCKTYLLSFLISITSKYILNINIYIYNYLASRLKKAVFF